jgi:hypothetical protein
MIALPTTMSTSVVTCAGFRIEDMSAWTEAAASAPGTCAQQDLRLSLEEVAEFLAIAWQMATEWLPVAINDHPGTMLWAYPPTVGFRLTAESPSWPGASALTASTMPACSVRPGQATSRKILRLYRHAADRRDKRALAPSWRTESTSRAGDPGPAAGDVSGRAPGSPANDRLSVPLQAGRKRCGQ